MISINHPYIYENSQNTPEALYLNSLRSFTAKIIIICIVPEQLSRGKI